MELVLVILSLALTICFVTLVNLNKELEESKSLNEVRSISLNNAEARVKTLSTKVQERDKLIKYYTESLTEILNLEILASDKVQKINELVRPANRN